MRSGRVGGSGGGGGGGGVASGFLGRRSRKEAHNHQ